MRVDPGTYGAILLGALFSASLSGVFSVQCIIYFKNYPTDRKDLKAFVLFVWCLELIHTGLVWASIWDSFIANFGNIGHVEYIPSTIALSVVLTAALTFLTHCLFAYRIYHLSQRNAYLTILVLILALGRLASASASGGLMIRLRSYPAFRHHFLWLFSMGLGLSCAVDILITLSLFYLLRQKRRQSIMLHSIIDSLILYAFEIGSLTSAATVASMLCWVILDNSLIFLGLHFVVGKLYANSLLATLNARNKLRQVHSTALDLMHLNLPHITNTTIAYVSPVRGNEH
ncbi:hypothetical protein GALMADRAFT_235123 [Galerina marginata CBS 339.88]|uniref:DUF6534 domain-containing protein n=1 Tax=Galerina marginata (strain CBS 339.88) TaxID=685588 RepID=A0A067U112_GALM3|nr:hypothetical protein GALMADRAFT_235123 [Galerina marginata CBS 339.88]